MGYLCPGGQEHFYPTWHCWDTVVGDHVGGGVYDTMDEAMLVLSQELKGE
jgi:hypothetical protein